MVDVCPILLAGGQSQRMGRDKALLKLPNGRSLLDQALHLLQGLRDMRHIRFLPPLISGARPGGIPDRVVGCGPLAGLQSVSDHLTLWRIHCDALLAIPVDMPLLQLQQLQQLCVAGASDVGAVCFGGCYLPCWLPLGNRCRDYLSAAANGGAVPSVRALLGYLGCTQLPEPAGDWNINVNRPEDFVRIAAMTPSPGFTAQI